MTNADTDDNELEPGMVLIIPRSRSGRLPKIHTDPECPTLHARGGNDPIKKRRSLVPHHEECSRCSGEYEAHNKGSPNDRAEQLSKMNPEDIGLSPLGGRHD